MTPEGLSSYKMLQVTEAATQANLEQLIVICDYYSTEIKKRTEGKQ